MQKFIIALCFMLVIASAQEACMNDVYASLPALQKMYMDYSNKNWAAVEGNIERFLPTAKLLLADCAGVIIPDTPQVQACVDTSKALARLIVPLIVNSQNETALIILLESIPGLLVNLESQCINPRNTTAAVSTPSVSTPYLRKNDNRVQYIKAGPSASRDVFQCWSKVTMISPYLKKFVADVKAAADYDTLRSDLEGIASSIDDVCTACGISLTKAVESTLADEKLCIANARKLATSAEKIVSSQKNIIAMINNFGEFIEEVPETLATCGLGL